jgi:hypothetical protein
MVHDITSDGLIVTPQARSTTLLDELVAICDWPILHEPTVRTLLEQIETHRPLCLLFWLESAHDVAPAAALVTTLRHRGPRPYRIAVAHCLATSAEQTLRAAGIHSYFSTSGDLTALIDEALLPLVEVHRAATLKRHASHPDTPTPIRSPTDVRTSPAFMRPP